MKKYLCMFFCLLIISGLCGCQKKEEENKVIETSVIPVVSIHLEEGQEGFEKIKASQDHSYECPGDLNIVMPDGSRIEDLRLEYMRGRGNSTWLADKKPYKIKFEDKQDLFSLGGNKHYVLLANAYDQTLLKNGMTFYIAEQLGMEFVPQGVNVELYVDDVYQGNYFFCEQVRIGDSRIDIEELDDETQVPDIWGGYLLSFSPWEEQEKENIFRTSRNVPFYNDTPGFVEGDEDSGNEEQKKYIRDYVQRCEDAVFTENDRGYEDLINVTSAADYWLIQEFCQNADAFNTPSSYAYKKRFEADGSEGKLCFGPLWDFDRAWGDTGFFSSDTAYFNHVTHDWINELRDKEEFVELLKERWKKLDAILDELIQEGGVYDMWVAENEASFDSDRLLWADFYKEAGMQEDVSYKEYCDALKEWIIARKKWINENLDDIGKILARITIRSDVEEERTVKLRLSSFLFEAIEAKQVDGYVFEGWFDEDGREIEENAFVKNDMILYAKYRKE